jgi:hypothetical protein
LTIAGALAVRGQGVEPLALCGTIWVVLIGYIFRYQIEITSENITKRSLLGARSIRIADVARFRVRNFEPPVGAEVLYPPYRLELYGHDERLLLIINVKLLRRLGLEDLLSALNKVVPTARRDRLI